jgi:hypothetical protein
MSPMCYMSRPSHQYTLQISSQSNFLHPSVTYSPLGLNIFFRYRESKFVPWCEIHINTTGILAEIQTENLPNTILGRYRYTNLLGKKTCFMTI